MSDFFAVMFINGGMTLDEILAECQTENWPPVLILRTPQGIVVPLFRDHRVCVDFIKRNVPKDQMVGIINLSEEKAELFTSKGWKIDWHDFPKSYVSRPGYEIDLDVIELEVEIHVKHNRKKSHT